MNDSKKKPNSFFFTFLKRFSQTHFTNEASDEVILNNVTKLRFKLFKIKLKLFMKLHYFATSYKVSNYFKISDTETTKITQIFREIS